jgi:PAS domain S-box-containing protein
VGWKSFRKPPPIAGYVAGFSAIVVALAILFSMFVLVRFEMEPRLLIAVGVVLVVVWAGLWSSGSLLVRPLRNLTAMAQHLGHGAPIRLPSSAPREIHAAAMALADADRMMRRTIAQYNDALEQTRAGEARLDAVLAAVRAASWRGDGTLGATHVDRSARTLLGPGTPDDASFATIRTQTDADGSRAFEVFLAALQRGGEAQADLPVAWHDGSQHWLRLRGMTGGDAADRTIASGVLIDIDELKSQEQRQGDGERHLRDLLATLDLSPSMVRDFDGTIRFWSRGCERLYGWTADEAIGRASHPLLQTVFPIPLAEIEAILLRDGEWRGDLHHRTRDGEQITVVAHKALRRGPAGEPVAVVESLTDVTRQREIEARLAQSQKMEAVGQLTGGIAHDFNNLLLAIGLTLETVEEEYGETDASLRPVIEGAKHATEQARTLIAQLLAFGRRQALLPQPFDLNQAIIDASRILRRTLEANVTIETVLGDGIWPAYADRNQFETALLNLAINARDAMADGGRLLIATSNQTLDTDYTAQQSEVAPGDYVVTAVSDSGSGIPAELQSRVFEPFFTTKPTGQGTGLGLSQVYGFMKQSGGHVTLYSEVGLGTTIRLYLPRALEPGRASEPAATAAPGGFGERILMVEDNKVVRDAAARVLRNLGYAVDAAATGDEALEILKTGATIDLLFTDMVLPGGMMGDRVAREARRIRPGIRVLLTSGYSQSLISGNLEGLENVSLLSKPYTIADLAKRVRTLFDPGGPDGAHS